MKTGDTILVPEQFLDQEKAYCDGYVDGWWKGQDETHTTMDPFTRRDWMLWVAAAFGFIVARLV